MALVLGVGYRWQVTGDMRYVTHDMWPVKHNIWFFLSSSFFFNIFCAWVLLSAQPSSRLFIFLMRKFSQGFVSWCCLLVCCSLLYTGLVHREAWLGPLAGSWPGELHGQVTVFDPATLQVVWARRQQFHFYIMLCELTRYDVRWIHLTASAPLLCLEVTGPDPGRLGHKLIYSSVHQDVCETRRPTHIQNCARGQSKQS